MFVNNIPFVISLGENMKSTTIENVVDRKAAILLKYLRSIKCVYTYLKNYKNIIHGQ